MNIKPTALASTILVPTDFSECSDAALREATEIARAMGAKIALLHCYDMPLVGPYDGAVVPSADIILSIEAAAKRGLIDQAARFRGFGVDIQTYLKNGDTRDIALDLANELGARMIVMGTHGRRGFTRALLGSVAEAIVRTSQIPVLTVHARAGGQSVAPTSGFLPTTERPEKSA